MSSSAGPGCQPCAARAIGVEGGPSTQGHSSSAIRRQSPVAFSWLADASSYDGTIDAYRFGWDITDLEDPDGTDPFVGGRERDSHG